MSEERTPVQVRLVTEIQDQEQKDQIVVEEPGDYIQKGNACILRFTETHEEEQIDNLVTIQEDKVIVRRTGPVRMNQVFRNKQVTENVYHHPYGNFHMETTTHTIQHQDSDESANGSLQIDYDLVMNGEQKQRHLLSLQYKEEDQT
ncbi:DUF1934 domain-containing protein [Pontibacillus sp. HMF3514]|uniref:DUF1934 domain-containing protein n=1 Tax=Pontibacillus sp. HMF3514 TaxID=2692425 RepID=UPI00131FAD6A|nr:DUF1934 domain-containing protein [Pontibacillus sp. HMF3514]QHE53863.1 DUF1934 family protein [Pontibacillus sp. HMF3514]